MSRMLGGTGGDGVRVCVSIMIACSNLGLVGCAKGVRYVRCVRSIRLTDIRSVIRRECMCVAGNVSPGFSSAFINGHRK